MADVPLYVVSDYASAERRITPSWSIAQLKTKLEPITGIPPSCQQIVLKTTSNEKIPVEAQDEESVLMQQFPLVPYAELLVSETSSRGAFRDSRLIEKSGYRHTARLCKTQLFKHG
jgi:tubulin-folding cofactor B